MLKKESFSLAACAFALTAGTEIQLLPAGEFRAADGRPKDAGAWRIDAKLAAAIIADVDARANRLVLDYEHQTLLSADNGQPAPAAGWFKKLEWRDGDGLYAVDVQWTERAAAMIAAGEYLYLSPVFTYDKKTGAVLRLINAALTNNPALDGMDAVAARAAAQFAADNTQTNQEDTPMKTALALLLGLSKDATEEDVMSRVTALRDAGAAHDAQITALKSQSPDPAKFVPIDTMQSLQTQVADLTAKLNGKEVDDAVGAALAAGKLLPAQEAWARDLGKSNLAALTSYIATAQPVKALSGTQTGGEAPAGGAAAGELTESQLAICKQTGVAPDDFKKTLAAA